MIDWLSAQGYGPLLWDFVTDCCRLNWAELQDEALQRVVEHFDRVGTRGIDEPLHDADRALGKLERRLRSAATSGEEAALNRRLGYEGIVVSAFGCQDGASAARVISRGLLEWASDSEAEARLQVESLRRVVPDPSKRAAQTKAESPNRYMLSKVNRYMLSKVNRAHPGRD
jgi:hypothetical protein